MIRKHLASILVLTALSTTAVTGDDVIVEFKGKRETFAVAERDKTTVCEFKQYVARRFGLNMNKFWITNWDGWVLAGEKTLAEQQVHDRSLLRVKETSTAREC